MNSIERRYAEFDPDWLTLGRDTKRDIVKMTVLYVMRAVSSKEYSSLVRSSTGWSGTKMAEFRTNLKFWGYLQRDIKFYIYEAVAEGTFTFSSRIFEADRSFIQRFIKAEDEYSKALRKQCKAYRDLGYVARNINVFSHFCDKLVPDLDLYFKRFVLKNLKFVLQQNSETIGSMVNELIMHGIYAVYRAYPEVQSNLHMLNIAKQAGHNHGENIIKSATTQSRARLTKNDDGTFSAKLVSIDSAALLTPDAMTLGGPTSSGLMVCNGFMTDIEGRTVANESVADVNRLIDLRNAVERLLKKFSSPKAKKFMELLMGDYDPDFSAWLGQDNDELYDILPRQEYAEKVRVYLEVSIEKARSFVQGLRTELSDFRN